MTAVLLVSPSAKPAGSERVVASLARHLPSFGFEPHTVVLEHGPLEGWLPSPPTVIEAGRFRELGSTVRTLRALVAVARERGAKAVVSHQSKGHVYGGLAARRAGLPEIWWQHAMPRRSPVDLVSALVPSDVVVCESDDVLARQRRLTPRRRLAKVHAGVPVAEIARRRGSGAAIRSALGWEEAPLVGIVGRLQPWKGQEVFLRAAARIAARCQDARFLVVGGAVLGSEGSYPGDLRRLAGELGLDGSVCFAGHQEDVYPWFDVLDVVVHASIGEPFGLVLVEAMALGKPLIATDAGGPTEIVEDGRSGLLVPPGDPGLLADAVERVLRDQGLADALGKAASERALLFTEEEMTRAFALILEDVLERRRRTR